MITEDQADVIRFLSNPASHGAPVERIDTHASVVFLAGARALKLKRAVRYDYLDFSTCDRRRAMCEAEVRLNRRTAPDLYRGVVAVTRQPDGSLALGGSGTPVDWLVEMVRFDQAALFDRQAALGILSLDLMRPLGRAIARFHQRAEGRPDHGGVSGMQWVVDGNAIGLAEYGAGVLDPAACASLAQRTSRVVARHADLLEDRRRSGLVRQCHGDLHLRNLVVLAGEPTLFDAVEFNDEIACTDVLYDLAFLLMDLWRRDLPAHANGVWNGYLFETGDLSGVPLMPLFLSCRAAVRAKTSATAAALQEDAGRRRELQQAARDYLALAAQLLEPPPPCVIAVGGLSGSGKSTLARSLAPMVGAVPGAVVIRSDEVRKQLCGVEPHRALGPDGYTPDVTQRVYATLLARAAATVRAGHAAVVDAVFARPEDRLAIEQVATAAGVPFVGLWLDAPEAVLLTRAGERRFDASDADAAVIHRQLAGETGVVTWHQVDANAAPAVVLDAAAAIVRAPSVALPVALG